MGAPCPAFTSEAHLSEIVVMASATEDLRARVAKWLYYKLRV